MNSRHLTQENPSPPAWPHHARPHAVVGIGASAGGIDALGELLLAISPGTGIAFVMVQHLDPARPSMLVELLQRMTPLRVVEAGDAMVLEPNTIYVAPPNAELTVARGVLAVQQLALGMAPRQPVDHFLRALAADQRQHAVGILLSGMNSDGTAGLRAVQEAGGITLVQSPESARYAPMPLSAIDAGVADEVMAPAAMGGRLLELLSGDATLQRGRGRRGALRELLQLLQQQTGHSFMEYKLNTVLRRIERRMKLHQSATLADYVILMRNNPGEVELLFREMLIGVTSFFRDPVMWEQLRAVVLPALFEAHPQGAAFKAWVPACSTGEEAYSLAMVFTEAVNALQPTARYTLQIFATDLDPHAIDRARVGFFAGTIGEALGPVRLQRYFDRDGHGYRVRKELRNMIIFAQQNVISDPPFTKLDILSCRNLLIYFTARLQEQLIPLFHYALKRDGLLLLGSADTPGIHTDLFAPLAGFGRIYRRLDSVPRRIANYFPTKASAVAALQPIEGKTMPMTGNLQSRVEQALLNKHVPAAVLVNGDGDILYIHGRTSPFLEPAAGKANWNVHAMAREELRYELASLLQAASAGNGQESVRGLVMRDGDGRDARLVDMTAEVQGRDGSDVEVLVTFSSQPLPAPVAAGRGKSVRVQELEQQVAQARAALQALRDEMQGSREELKSANEELQSTNEELQSTNEELTTSKEEMQSLNEELYTVNAELQTKVDDLSRANGDMKNLLDSTDIAVIFLDNALNIRRFTTQATQIYKLIPGDVNRPLGDIVNDLDYPQLEDDARGVLNTLVYSEKQIATRDGRWYVVRIMPYRTVDNVIDGLVVTFINISELKQLVGRLQSEDQARRLP